jgi:hypothetical protein
MQDAARDASRTPDAEPDVIISIQVAEVRGRGYQWILRSAEGENMEQSPVFASLYQCLADLRDSAFLSPGSDPYTRRS